MEGRWRVGGYEKRRVAVEAQSEFWRKGSGQRDGRPRTPLLVKEATASAQAAGS